MARGTVVIDPGHGGTFEVGGSSWNNAISFSGVPEKSMTLQIALLVRDALQAAAGGHQLEVVLTRTKDENLGLEERANVARDHHADLFLSIHFNGFNKQARGVETLVRPVEAGNINHVEDVAFARRIQDHVFNAISALDPNTRDRGVKDQRLAVLRDAALGNTPASHRCRACLLEIEFIDVEAVDQLLNTNPGAPAARSAIATAIRDAIIEDLEAAGS